MSNNKIKAVVIKTEGRNMKVATEDRRFLTMTLPEGGAVSDGEEVWLDAGEIAKAEKKKGAFLFGRSRALAAAVVVFLMLAGMVYSTVMPTKEAAAYLAVDINPSLELALDPDNQVMEITPYNEEGKELAQEVTMEETDIFSVLENIFQEAKDKEHISSGEENLFLVTLVGVDELSEPVVIEEGGEEEKGESYEVSKEEFIDGYEEYAGYMEGLTGEELFSEKLARTLSRLDIAGSIGVQRASMEDRERASEEEKSLNNYVLQKKASKEMGIEREEFESKGNRDVIEELAERDMVPARIFDEFEVSEGMGRLTPNQEMIPPGQKEVPPGQEEFSPGQERVPPGLERVPPGQERTPPGLEKRPDIWPEREERENEDHEKAPPERKGPPDIPPGQKEDGPDRGPIDEESEDAPPGLKEAPGKEAPPGQDKETPGQEKSPEQEEPLEKEESPEEIPPGREEAPGREKEPPKQEEIPPGQKEDEED